MMDPGRPIDVAVPHLARRGRIHRVTATVACRRAWFESTDLPLAASSEAFGAAFLLPALHAGRPLRLAGRVCETWASRLTKLTDAFRGQWYPEAPRPLVVPGREPDGLPTMPRSGTALCFSGGVDDFYAVLAGGERADVLVCVDGYHARLNDRRWIADVEALVRGVAAEMGCRAALVRTNVRRHPLLKAMPWERAYVGPLAAIGHAAGSPVGRLLISSSGFEFAEPDIISRPDTDLLFGSATLSIEHVAAGVTQFDKIRAIVVEPIVQRHLHVCGQNLGGRPNCGRCEKCVRTMLTIDAHGMLGRFASFDHGRGLEQAIDSLPSADGDAEAAYRDLLARGLSAAPAAAVRRLLARSPAGAAVRLVASPGPLVLASEQRRRQTPLAPFRHRLFTPAAFDQVCGPLVGRRVGYVRPEGNVGDRLIEVAMVQLFAEYGIRWRLVSLGETGDSDGLDVLAFGGGGNMGIRYSGNHEIRTQALVTGLPVVILPQSFTGPENRPFARVFVRERGSLALRPDGVLAPDLALGLATAEPARPDRDLGVYLRRDQERAGRKPLFARDPVRMFQDPFAYLAFAGRHRRIVTDRLHFAIAGLHAGCDVTLVANDYHKNRSLHETWLAELGCRFAASVAEALGRRAA